MWRLMPKTDNELVSVVLTPRYLTCSWIQHGKGKHSFELKAYCRYNLPPTAFNQSVVFNPTGLKKYVQSFLQAHNLQHAFVTLSVAGSGITEKFISLNTASPSKKDFNIPELSNALWDYNYLYPKHTTQSVFYVSGIQHALLFQYKLFTIATNIHVTSIVTQGTPLLQLYKYVHGTAFRRSQLAIDMINNNNTLLSLFTSETIRRLLHIAPSISINQHEEISPLLKSIGLFIAESDSL